jgi:hypothetical protein
MPLGWNSAQWPTHSDAWPSPSPHHSGARGPLAELTHGLHGTRRVSTHRSGHCSPGARRGVAGDGATVAEVGQGWALKHPWRRGHPSGKWVEVAAHPSFLPTGTVEKPDGGGVLRRGGCSGGRRCPASGWERGGSSDIGVPREKGGKGVLGAPLTVEGVATAEAAKAPAMGRLLAASSCTDGERVVRGGSRLQSKTRRCGDTGEAATRWPYQRRSGARLNGEARSNSGDGGVQTRAVWRCSDSEAAA